MWRVGRDKRSSLLCLFLLFHSLGKYGDRLFCHRTNLDWSLTPNAIQQNKFNRLDSILIKMIFQTVIYHIWSEKNATRHQGKWMSTDQMRKVIDRSTRNIIVSLKYGLQHRNAGFLQRWFQLTG